MTSSLRRPALLGSALLVGLLVAGCSSTTTTGGATAAGTPASSSAAPEDATWAGQFCTDVQQAVSSTSQVSAETPPKEKLTDANFSIWQARLGTAVGQASGAVQNLTSDLTAAPGGVSSAVQAVKPQADALAAAFKASGTPLSQVAGAPDVATAEKGMAAAKTAVQQAQSAATALAQSVQAQAGSGAFAAAPQCATVTSTAAASGSPAPAGSTGGSGESMAPSDSGAASVPASTASPSSS